MTGLDMAGRSRAFAATLTLLVTGCVSVDSEADRSIAEQRMARPAAIVVQNFALSPDAPEPVPAAGVTTSGSAAEVVPPAQLFSDALASNLVDEIRRMGLPAIRPDTPLPSSGNVVTLEGRFVSVPGGDSAESALVSFAEAWPDVVLDVEIYDTTETDDRLVEDFEFRLTDTNALIPAPPADTGSTEPASGRSAISPALQAKLDGAARDGARKIAEQLQPFFADQGWIARPGAS
jgi:Domain of unknown function (DUF4410)